MVADRLGDRLADGVLGEAGSDGGSSYDRAAALYDRLVPNSLYSRLAWKTDPDDYVAFADEALADADGPFLDAAGGSGVATGGGNGNGSVERSETSIGEALARGTAGGAVFATLVTITSLAGSLWMSLREGDELRTVAIGPDPIATVILALAWGVGGGAAVSVLGSLRSRVSRRA